MTGLSLSSTSRMPDQASLQLKSKHELTRSPENWESRQIVAQLRASIAVGALNLDAMLQRIVDAAQLFTDANGAAIALQQDDSVVCRARAGEMAPDLSSRLNSDSGISGECLRSGKALCCHDAWADSRVDAEACRRLGLRSLAAAPIGESPKVYGILEAFSAQPHAFGDSEIKLLEELAELVSAAQQGREPTAVGTRIREKFAARAPSFSKGKLIVAGFFALLLLVWIGLRKKPERPRLATTVGAQPLKSPSSPPAIDPSTVALKSEGLPVRHDNTRAKPSAGIVMASNIRKFGASENAIAQPLPKAASNPGTPPLNTPVLHLPSPQPADESTPVPPPVVTVSVSSDKGIAGLLSDSSAFPQQPSVRLSQGLSGGTLQDKVNPVYPAVALVQRRQGQVTLDGVIAEDGKLHDLKVIKGDPLLARAAMQAVSQWRYQPYKLNGEPISRPTTITLIFKLP